MSEEVKEDVPEEPSEGNEEEERAELAKYVEDLLSKIKVKTDLRQQNLTRVLPQESYFTKLDSSLKKNTAFVKKLKQFTAAQLDSLLKDMDSLNLTKYISEVSSAITEAKLKMTDVPAIIQLCCKLHRIYGDFAQSFFENWQKLLSIKPGEKVANASKMRVDLRLYCELVSIGIFSNKVSDDCCSILESQIICIHFQIGLPLLGTTIMNLINQDKEEHSHLSIILSFCKHCGEEYAGLTSRRVLLIAKV